VYSIEVQGLSAVRQRIRDVPRQFRFAGAGALNEVAFIAARRAVPAEMAQVFDRPKPYILRSPWYTQARPDRLVAALGVSKHGGPGYAPEQLTPGVVKGGKGNDPADTLRAEVFGGPRALKKSERLFQRAGVLPAGYAMVPAKWLIDSVAGDGYGGIKASFIVRLLSYLQAFGEQGFKANMKAKGIRRLARFGKTDSGFKRIGGVQYFVSYGRLRSLNADSDALQHLKPGIWQRSGTHGSDVKPVFLFTKVPSYAKRLRLGEVISRAVQENLPRAFDQRLRRALASAR